MCMPPFLVLNSYLMFVRPSSFRLSSTCCFVSFVFVYVVFFVTRCLLCLFHCVCHSFCISFILLCSPLLDILYVAISFRVFLNSCLLMFLFIYCSFFWPYVFRLASFSLHFFPLCSSAFSVWVLIFFHFMSGWPFLISF